MKLLESHHLEITTVNIYHFVSILTAYPLDSSLPLCLLHLSHSLSLCCLYLPLSALDVFISSNNFLSKTLANYIH